MKVREVALVAALCAVSLPAAAMMQDQKPPGQPPRPDSAKPDPPRAEPRPRPPIEANVTIEVTISDQTGGGQPERKTVSMTAADSSMGRVRSATIGALAVLNVDARPRIQGSNRVLLELTVEYTPASSDGDKRERRGNLHESLTVLLQDGKPQVISQASDPMMDRKMTVEVKATILK